MHNNNRIVLLYSYLSIIINKVLIQITIMVSGLVYSVFIPKPGSLIGQLTIVPGTCNFCCFEKVEVVVGGIVLRGVRP